MFEQVGLSRFSVILIASFLYVFGAKAQCPEYSFLVNRFKTVSTGTLYRKEALQEILTKWNACNIQKDSVYCEIASELSYEYWVSGIPNKSLLYIQEAIRSSQINTGHNSLLPKLQYYLGGYLNVLNRFDEARTAFIQSIHLGERLGQPLWVSASCIHLAHILNSNGEYRLAIDIAKKGEHFGRISKNKEKTVFNIRQQAYSWMLLDDFQKANSTIISAISLIENDKSPDYNYVFFLAAEIFDSQKNDTQALIYARKSLNLVRDDRSENTAMSHMVLGNIFTRKKEFNIAKKEYYSALKITRDSSAKATILARISSIYQKENKHKEALLFQQKGIGAITGLSLHSFNENPSSSTIKYIYRKYILLEIMIQKCESTLQIFKESKDKKYSDACLESVRISDEMIDITRWNQDDNVAKLFWRTKVKTFYETALNICELTNNHGKALYYLEKSRSVLLSDRLNELSAQQRLSSSDSKKELTFRKEIKKLQDGLASVSGLTRTQYQARLDSFTQAQHAFIRSLEKTNPIYFRYKYNNYVPSLKAVRDSLLADNQLFISYFFGDSVGYAIGISKAGSVFKKWPLVNYTSDAQTFLRLCSQPFRTQTDARRFQEVSYRLYRLLIEPLSVEKVSRLIVSQDGAFLPFEALLTSPKKLDYLLCKHAISYTYSAGLLLRPREESGSSRPFLGIAPERFASSLGQHPLLGSVDALSRIEAYVQSPARLIRSNATKRNFLEQAADYRILQLFTHADADSTEIREPVLYFADSALRLSELDAARQFHTQLLVLSACKTSVGVDQKGEGVFSLARGFAALGIPSIITTLWSVEDRATYGIIRSFYRYLAEGLPQDVALQKARLDALSADSQPYYWSGLIHIGDSQPVPLAADSWWYWAGGGLLAAAGAWVLVRRKNITSSPRRGN